MHVHACTIWCGHALCRPQQALPIGTSAPDQQPSEQHCHTSLHNADLGTVLHQAWRSPPAVRHGQQLTQQQSSRESIAGLQPCLASTAPRAMCHVHHLNVKLEFKVSQNTPLLPARAAGRHRQQHSGVNNTAVRPCISKPQELVLLHAGACAMQFNSTTTHTLVALNPSTVAAPHKHTNAPETCHCCTTSTEMPQKRFQSKKKERSVATYMPIGYAYPQQPRK